MAGPHPNRRDVLAAAAIAPLVPRVWAGPPKLQSPLPTAHAHNDYEQPSPFHGSFGLGFRSFEVDVFPVDGRLMVAHDRADIRGDRTFESMYLAPILARCRAGDDPRRGPCPSGRRLTLLIDIKRNGPTAATLLESALEPLLPWLRRVERGRIVEGPIEVIVSGHRPIENLIARNDRLLFIDGRIRDLDDPPPVELMPLVSASFRPTVGAFGFRRLDETARARIGELAERARSRGRRLRFWGHMEAPWVWSVLVGHRVDLIGSDVPWALARWLRANDPRCRILSGDATDA